MYICRRVEVKKAWAVHLAEQQQKQQQGSDAEEEEEAQDPETRAVDAAEVPTCPLAIMSCPSLQQACRPGMLDRISCDEYKQLESSPTTKPTA